MLLNICGFRGKGYHEQVVFNYVPTSARSYEEKSVGSKDKFDQLCRQPVQRLMKLEWKRKTIS